MADESTNGARIALTVSIVFFVVVIICLVFSGTYYFTNLKYDYKLPIIGIVSNLQDATVPRMRMVPIINRSSEEPGSSEEPRNSEEPTSSEEVYMSYSDQSLLIGLYSNEKRNMNPFGDYKIISAVRKQESIEIDNLLQRLNNAANSGLLG
jgi:hypothetical protein